jgi:hypothetical protein
MMLCGSPLTIEDHGIPSAETRRLDEHADPHDLPDRIR